jgi:hypothetical protein
MRVAGQRLSFFLVGEPQHERDPARGFEVADRAPRGRGLFLCRRLGRAFLLQRVDGRDHGALGGAAALDGKRDLRITAWMAGRLMPLSPAHTVTSR